MKAPMMSWVEGLLADCENEPELLYEYEAYGPDRIVRALRWLHDRVIELETE
jgi:hypothetical protein